MKGGRPKKRCGRIVSVPRNYYKIAKARETMNKKGFTLLELIFCIAILGILMAIGIPGYMDYLPRYRANGAIRRLFTELQYAKMKAIADNNDYVVTFDTASNRYNIYNDADNDGAELAELVKTVDIDEGFPGISFGYVAGNNWNGDDIDDSITFSGTPPKVTFSPTGQKWQRLSETGGRFNSQRQIQSRQCGSNRAYPNIQTQRFELGLDHVHTAANRFKRVYAYRGIVGDVAPIHCRVRYVFPFAFGDGV